MSDAVQVEQNEPVAASGQQPPAAPAANEYRWKPGAERPADNELFAFRTALAQTMQEEDAKPKKAKPKAPALLLGAVAVAALLAFVAYGGMTLIKPKPASLYIDLGTQRYDPSGLGGRLIAQWTGSAAYKFTLDPLDASQIPGFQAVVANPPHAITFTIRLKDAQAAVACQKDIVIPAGDQGNSGSQGTQAAIPNGDGSPDLAPRTTPTGDTMQNTSGDGGKIGETVLTGSLPCSLDAYRRIVAWDFSTDFPPLQSQQQWEKHEDAVAATHKGKSGPASPRTNYGGYTLIKSLPAPIEGDNVIVSDNPSRGIVATADGHAFLVGSAILVNPALDWQIFPAQIHYRCEKNAMCMLTRLSSHTAVHANLMK
jgi:hypothetical protein